MAFTGRIGHLEDIESPWGNAGGVVKTIDDVDVIAHTGVGWVEAGSYTLEPRLGNAWNPEAGQFDRIVYHHDAAKGETSNSLGMPNKGMDVVEREIPEMVRIAHAHDKPLVVNVAPVSNEPASETVELSTWAYAAGADAVLINAGCPNVVVPDGGRHELLSRSPYNLYKVLKSLYEADLPKPVFVRISPTETMAKAGDTMEAIVASRCVSAVFTPNTWPGHKPVDDNGEEVLKVPGGVGGKSGPATDLLAQAELLHAFEFLRNTSIDIVSSGGIMHANALERRLRLGAVAAAGTTFFYESRNGWPEDVNRLLDDFSNI